MSNVSSATSHFTSAEEGFTTTLASTISSGATTVPLNSVAGYSNGEVVAFVVDPTNASKKQVFTGIVDTGGVQITNVVWTEGTNQDHTAGATVVDYTTASHQNLTTKGILVHADQDGTLKAGAVDNATVLASDVVTTAKILDSNVTTAKIADDAVTAAKVDWASTGVNGGIWWEELGRTTLGSGADTIAVASFPARKFLQVRAFVQNTGGTNTLLWTFNSDASTNYSRTNSTDFAAGATSTSQGSLQTSVTSADTKWCVMDIINVAAQEKLLSGRTVRFTTAGGGTAPGTFEFFGKWANTADQITTITLTNSGTGDFATGSEVVVLGHN